MLSTILTILNLIPGVTGVLETVFPQLKNSPTVNEVLKIVDGTQADVANYDSGQAVVVATIPQNAVPGATAAGVLVAMQDGGPAYNSIFGSN